MDDARAPWVSRVEAAAALATRLRDRHEQTALERLHAAVSDLEGQAGHRLIAADALSECGEGQRTAAEQALRVILADPFATPREHRDAALVMASLGGEARADAASALLTTLNDPESPPARLSEAADGLVEITLEHADRCAEVLADVLRTTSILHGPATLQTAAETIGSLGPRHVDMGVRALCSRIADVRLDRWERIAAAGTLARIGPSYRSAAVKHLLGLSEEPGVQPYEFWRLGEMLRQCGWEYRERAASVLRRALSHITISVNTTLWAARELCEIGPDYRAEAVGHLIRLSEATAHHHAVNWERENALGTVAAADESRRSCVVTALRASLADRKVELKRRERAAFELVELGPEFHGEVIGPLSELAAQRFNLDVMLSAWRSLARLDTGFRAEAAAALIELLESSGEVDRMPPDAVWFTRTDFDRVQVAENVLLRVLEDSSRDPHWRAYAARSLIIFGQPFHRTAVHALIDLIRSELLPTKGLFNWLSELTYVAGVFRDEVAQALCEMALLADSTSAVVLNAAEAMQAVSGEHPPSLVTVFRSILADESADPEHRIRSAVLVALARPELAEAAVGVVLDDRRERHHDWTSELCQLALAGADPLPRLHEIAVDPAVRATHRVRALGTLVRLGRCEAAEVLRQHADDSYLEHSVRMNALEALAEHSKDQTHEAIAYQERVRDDSTEGIGDRCDSAYRLYRLDVTATSAAVDLLRQVALKQDLTPFERVSAIPVLRHMTYHETADTDFLASAIAHDPACGAAERRTAFGYQESKGRLAGQRAMLADRSITLEDRLPVLEYWEFRPLRRETEAAVRDVLSAPESTHRERVTAAVALAQLSSRFVSEAAELLGGLGWDGQAELAKLGPRWSSQVRAHARATIADETKPWRERWRAARLVWTGVEPRSDEQRMEWAEARGEIGVLRVMLNHTQPAIRCGAAKRLREYDFADRVNGARVLEEIGRDPKTKPALRWRAGEELTKFGAKGRESGVAVLRNIMGDERLPVMARVEAASVVGRIRPDLRAEVVRFLRRMRADKPLQQIKLYQAIGVFEPEEGARALWAMTNGGTPTTRIRAAEAMFGLRRDYRERAAITARSVMRDATAPAHVRRRAAGDLARWSDLCLEEARAALG